MLEAIFAAVTLLAVDGTCLEAHSYPEPTADVTGYVMLQSCAIPTTVDATAPVIVARYANTIDRLYGDGRKNWKPGECRIMPAGHRLAYLCERNEARS